MEWLEDSKIPVGKTAAAFVDWLKLNARFVFDFIEVLLSGLTDSILFLLEKPHPAVIILLFAGIAYALQRSWSVPVFVIVVFLFVLNQGYWDETMSTLTIILSACVLCMGIGVPIGIACARKPWLYRLVRPMLDLMQTLPSFVYLIPAVVFFGLGLVPGLIATIIFALPAPIRMTYLGISSTPAHLREAGLAFGASTGQLLLHVELRHAMPQIMAGLTQTIMLSLSMVVIAAFVGAPGLGVPVIRALNSVDTALGFEAGFVIVMIAIMLDRMFRTRDSSKQ